MEVASGAKPSGGAKAATSASERGPVPSGGGHGRRLRVATGATASVQELCGREKVQEGSASVRISSWEASSRKTARTRSRGQGRGRWSGTKAASTRGCVDPEGIINSVRGSAPGNRSVTTDDDRRRAISGLRAATASSLRGWVLDQERGRLRLRAGAVATAARSPLRGRRADGGARCRRGHPFEGGERDGASGTGGESRSAEPSGRAAQRLREQRDTLHTPVSRRDGSRAAKEP